MTRLCFLDTETTGLTLDDDIWEFAAIVREPDGSGHTCHMFIEHDTQRCNKLPPEFIADHRARFPTSGTSKWHPDVLHRGEAAEVIAGILSDRVHIVGAVPNFDTERIALLLRRHGLEPDWHYHLIDVEALAVGFLHGVVRQAGREVDASGHLQIGFDQVARDLGTLPWDSNTLSRALGIDPDAYERHTALGDARWVRDQYDAITRKIKES